LLTVPRSKTLSIDQLLREQAVADACRSFNKVGNDAEARELGATEGRNNMGPRRCGQ